MKRIKVSVVVEVEESRETASDLPHENQLRRQAWEWGTKGAVAILPHLLTMLRHLS